MDEEEDRSGQRKPRVLIAGEGEPRIDEVCEALRRRGIEPVLVQGALDEAIRSERPNLVLLVGDASSDDGASGIDDARRGGPTPVVVATDPEPLDRRLAPFQYGARGIVVRRNDPDEMAGEVQHLLAENARRTAERARTGRTPSELDELVGLGSRELRLSATPHEGISRIAALEEAHRDRSAASAELEGPSGDVAPRARGTGSLADWDEDLATQRQPNDDVARWRRLSKSDRTQLPTPEVMIAWSESGESISQIDPTRPATSLPRDAVTVERSLENVHSRYERPTAEREIPELALERERAIARANRAEIIGLGAVRHPIDDEWEATTATHDEVLATLDAVRAREVSLARGEGRAAYSDEPTAAPLGSEAPDTTSSEPAAPSPHATPQLAPDAPSVASPRPPRPPPPTPRVSATGERISASALLALSPPSRPPIEDRASTLRAQAMPRPRASVVPALVLLGLTTAAVGSLVVRRMLESSVRENDGIAAIAMPRVEPSAHVEPDSVPAETAIAVASPSAPIVPAPPSAIDETRGAPIAAAEPEVVAPPIAVVEPEVVAPPVAVVGVAPMGPVSDRDRSDALVEQAAEVAASGNAAGARALLDEANAADPNNPHALIALASASLEAGDAPAAVRFAERAVAVRRRRATYHVVLGDAHERAGDHARAVESWRAALELEPDHAAARARLAR